jgi:hypothetical protein
MKVTSKDQETPQKIVLSVPTPPLAGAQLEDDSFAPELPKVEPKVDPRAMPRENATGKLEDVTKADPNVLLEEGTRVDPKVEAEQARRNPVGTSVTLPNGTVLTSY